jgi:hypothetical protein
MRRLPTDEQPASGCDFSEAESILSSLRVAFLVSNNTSPTLKRPPKFRLQWLVVFQKSSNWSVIEPSAIQLYLIRE